MDTDPDIILGACRQLVTEADFGPTTQDQHERGDIALTIVKLLRDTQPSDAVDALTTALASTVATSNRPGTSEEAHDTVMCDFGSKFFHMRLMLARDKGFVLTPSERAFIVRKQEEINAKLVRMMQAQ